MSVHFTKINMYISSMVIPIGFIINFFSAYIFSRKALNVKTRIGCLHAILCIFNTFPLVNSLLISQVLPYFEIYLLEASSLSCKFLSFWRKFATVCPSFQQILITFMLYMSIKYPSKFMSLQNCKKLIAIVGCTLLFAVLVDIPGFFFELTQTNETNGTNTTVYTKNCVGSDTLTMTFELTTISLRYIIPFYVMLILNILMMRYFYFKQQTIAVSIKGNIQRKNNGPKNFLISIMIVNVLFLVLYFPWAISYLIICVNYFLNVKLLDNNLVYAYNFGLTISYLNNLTPFFVHLIFNTLFRQQILIFFKLRK